MRLDYPKEYVYSSYVVIRLLLLLVVCMGALLINEIIVSMLILPLGYIILKQIEKEFKERCSMSKSKLIT